MFLSLARRPRNPWGINVLDGRDDFFTFLDELVTPEILYTTRGQRTSNKDQHQKCPLKRINPEKLETESSTVPIPEVKKGRFELKMDLEGFKPDELRVKLVDNCLTIQGNHDSTDKHGGTVSRQFMRKCTIPDDVNLEEMTCSLNSSQGNIVISAPRKIEQPQVQERVIPINFENSSTITTHKPVGPAEDQSQKIEISSKDEDNNAEDTSSKVSDAPMAA